VHSLPLFPCVPARRSRPPPTFRIAAWPARASRSPRRPLHARTLRSSSRALVRRNGELRHRGHGAPPQPAVGAAPPRRVSAPTGAVHHGPVDRPRPPPVHSPPPWTTQPQAATWLNRPHHPRPLAPFAKKPSYLFKINLRSRAV